MSIYKIVRSKGYKKSMAALYGIGAAIVIMGALFKIIHAKGADLMLIVGMTTEALIFFFSSFEPLHKEFDWAIVYPELGQAEGANGNGKPKGNVTQQLDKMLSDAKIGPELIESLASGMRNLSDNARKLSTITDAAAVTEGYVANISKAKDAMQNLAGVYEKSADVIVSTSDMQARIMQEVVEKQKEHAQKVQETLSSTTEMQAKSAQELFEVQKQHAQKLQTTLSTTSELQEKRVQELYDLQKEQTQKLLEVQVQSVQKVGQIQEQGTQAIQDYYKRIEENTTKLSNSMNDAAVEAQNYKQEVDKLAKNMAQINAIYANMLAAMTTK